MEQPSVDKVHNAEGFVNLVGVNLALLHTCGRERPGNGRSRRCGEFLWRLRCVRVPQYCAQHLQAMIDGSLSAVIVPLSA